MILKLSLLLCLISSNVFAINVLIARKSILFEEKIVSSMLKSAHIPSMKKSCTPLSIKDLKSNSYITSHYINKNSILCLKDVKVNKDNSVIFNFGFFQIEKKGKIIFENDKFIRIKKENGKIEKIYKDGRLK